MESEKEEESKKKVKIVDTSHLIKTREKRDRRLKKYSGEIVVD